jgi:hypothetical protein
MTTEGNNHIESKKPQLLNGDICHYSTSPIKAAIHSLAAFFPLFSATFNLKGEAVSLLRILKS